MKLVVGALSDLEAVREDLAERLREGTASGGTVEADDKANVPAIASVDQPTAQLTAEDSRQELHQDQRQDQEQDPEPEQTRGLEQRGIAAGTMTQAHAVEEQTQARPTVNEPDPGQAVAGTAVDGAGAAGAGTSQSGTQAEEEVDMMEVVRGLRLGKASEDDLRLVARVLENLGFDSKEDLEHPMASHVLTVDDLKGELQRNNAGE